MRNIVPYNPRNTLEPATAVEHVLPRSFLSFPIQRNHLSFKDPLDLFDKILNILLIFHIIECDSDTKSIPGDNMQKY